MRKRDWVAVIVLALMVGNALLDRGGEVSARRPPIPGPQAERPWRTPPDSTPVPVPAPADRLPVVEGEGWVQWDARREPGFSTGTAFPVNDAGALVTALHVVQGCDTVLIAGDSFPDGSQAYRVVRVAAVHPQADLALLDAGEATEPLPFAPRLPGPESPGFHYGFPGGSPGAAASMLMGRASLRATGVRDTREPVLVWARVRTWPDGLASLGGTSGGPTLDRSGAIVGITIAEDPRRGRVYSTAPEMLPALLPAGTVDAAGALSITDSNWLAVERRLRDTGLVRKVLCAVGQQRLQVGQTVRLMQR